MMTANSFDGPPQRPNWAASPRTTIPEASSAGPVVQWLLLLIGLAILARVGWNASTDVRAKLRTLVEQAETEEVRDLDSHDRAAPTAKDGGAVDATKSAPPTDASPAPESEERFEWEYIPPGRSNPDSAEPRAPVERKEVQIRPSRPIGTRPPIRE
jgi:hypothetical protein